MTNSFNVFKRNTDHWDIGTKDGRLFRIRGGPGQTVVHDHRYHSSTAMSFRSVQSAMSYITDELMYEPAPIVIPTPAPSDWGPATCGDDI